MMIFAWFCNTLYFTNCNSFCEFLYFWDTRQRLLSMRGIGAVGDTGDTGATIETEVDVSKMESNRKSISATSISATVAG